MESEIQGWLISLRDDKEGQLFCALWASRYIVEAFDSNGFLIDHGWHPLWDHVTGKADALTLDGVRRMTARARAILSCYQYFRNYLRPEWLELDALAALYTLTEMAEHYLDCTYHKVDLREAWFEAILARSIWTALSCETTAEWGYGIEGKLLKEIHRFTAPLPNVSIPTSGIEAVSHPLIDRMWELQPREIRQGSLSAAVKRCYSREGWYWANPYHRALSERFIELPEPFNTGRGWLRDI